VVVLAVSVKNSDENSILLFYPMKAYNTSFQILNGSITSYMEAWNKLDIIMLKFKSTIKAIHSSNRDWMR
jgi:hypothetical protein